MVFSDTSLVNPPPPPPTPEALPLPPSSFPSLPPVTTPIPAPPSTSTPSPLSTPPPPMTTKNPNLTAPYFPALKSSVDQFIAALGSAVFPKLNWSAPKDVAWISTDGSLRYTSFTDIALLLHSSDRTVHDLCHAILSCSDSSSLTPFSFFLALRKFYTALRPDMEFHCFIHCGRLLAASQREITAFYPSLLDRRRELRRIIEDFFDEVVEPRFELEDYTFDVYVKRDWKIKLLDFNPWGAFTLPLLFSWEELEKESFGEEEEEVEFRLVDSQCGAARVEECGSV